MQQNETGLFSTMGGSLCSPCHVHRFGFHPLSHQDS